MHPHRFAVPALAAAALFAAGAGPQQTPPAEAAAPEADPAAAAIEGLRRDFDNLYRSFQAQGGITPRDHAAIRELRDRAAAVRRDQPDEELPAALELQLSVWLGENERVDALFAEMLRLSPDDPRHGLAWAAYYRRLDDARRVEEIYARLQELYPKDERIRVELAAFQRDRNEYGKVIELLAGGDVDLAGNARAALVLSDAYFAEHRFQEAIDLVKTLAPSAREADPGSTSEIDRVLPLREVYPELWAREVEIRSAEDAAGDLPRAELSVKDRGLILVELFENQAPNTVANFLKLAGQGFYDGTRFHRVIGNFMAQGGDPNSREGAEGTPGEGGPGYRIADEHKREGARNHFAGSLAMAKTEAEHSGGSQFYITHTPTPHLNGRHTVFGRVLEGLDVARSIQKDDLLESVRIVRKRDHEYEPGTLPELEAPAPSADEPG